MKKIILWALVVLSCGCAPEDVTPPKDADGEPDFLPYQYEYILAENTTLYFTDATMTVESIEESESYEIKKIDDYQFEFSVVVTSSVGRFQPGKYSGIFRKERGIVDMGCRKEALVNLFLSLKLGEIYYPENNQPTSATLPRKYIMSCQGILP